MKPESITEVVKQGWLLHRKSAKEGREFILALQQQESIQTLHMKDKREVHKVFQRDLLPKRMICLDTQSILFAERNQEENKISQIGFDELHSQEQNPVRVYTHSEGEILALEVNMTPMNSVHEWNMTDMEKLIFIFDDMQQISVLKRINKMKIIIWKKLDVGMHQLSHKIHMLTNEPWQRMAISDRLFTIGKQGYSTFNDLTWKINVLEKSD